MMFESLEGYFRWKPNRVKSYTMIELIHVACVSSISKALIGLASQAAIELKPRLVMVKLATPSSFWPAKVGVGDNKDRPQKNPKIHLS